MLVGVFTRGMVVWFYQFSTNFLFVVLFLCTLLFFAVSVHILFLHVVLLSIKNTLLTSIMAYQMHFLNP